LWHSTHRDFDFRDETIKVSRSNSEVNGSFHLVSTKSGKPRVLPIPEFILADLRTFVLGKSSDEPVFKSIKGKPLRRSNFARNVFKPALERVGLKGFRFHDLRHTAISLLANSGADIMALSRVMGHSKPSTTLNIYAHELDSSTETIRLRLDSMVAKNRCDRNATDGDAQSA
jgi:integrase